MGGMRRDGERLGGINLELRGNKELEAHRAKVRARLERYGEGQRGSIRNAAWKGGRWMEVQRVTEGRNEGGVFCWGLRGGMIA